MATASRMTIVDGQIYQPGEEVPDLGSWVAIKASGGIRDYIGLSADLGKLPRYVGTGSSAYCIDTGDVYKYEKKTGAWYRQQMCGNGSDGTAQLDYPSLSNKPRINGVELDGDLTLGDLGITDLVRRAVIDAGSSAGGVPGMRFFVDEENACLCIEY